jgi:hypothetical protein
VFGQTVRTKVIDIDRFHREVAPLFSGPDFGRMAEELYNLGAAAQRAQAAASAPARQADAGSQAAGNHVMRTAAVSNMQHSNDSR